MTHMIQHQCACGQHVDVGIEPDIQGAGYRVEFRIYSASSSHSRSVNNCPRCQRDYYDSLCDGSLRDITYTNTRRSA